VSALRWVFGLGRSGRGRLVLAVVLGALASGAAIALSATAAWLIARASQRPEVLTLMVAIVAVRAFGLARGALRYGERLTGHDASFRILGDLRVAVVERLEQVIPGRGGDGNDPLRTGDLLGRFVDDVDTLQNLWVRVLLPYASAILVGMATVTFVTILVPAAGAALALSLLAAAALAPVVSVRTSRAAATRLAPLRVDYQTRVLDLMAGATELSVYGALPARLEQLGHIDAEMTRAESRAAVSAGLGAAVAALAAGVAMWAALWFGAGAVDAGTLAGVNLAVVALLPLAAHEIFAGLPPAAHQLPMLSGAAARVADVFHRPAAVEEPTVAAPAPTGPFGLRVRGLRARWQPDPPDVLRGIDLDLPPGSPTLLVGASGCGKSTLAAVLLRLLDPASGSVELVGTDGSVDITMMSGDSVREIIGWCAQDAYIFDSTIEANLRLARPDATVAEIDVALHQARLDGWVKDLPDQLQTMVGEHGRWLSAGQRQRLALARVVLAGRSVVIFDEPTEHLDEPTAAALAVDLIDATVGKTVIVVTHRPELFPMIDRRLDMVDGRLATASPVQVGA